MKINFVVPEIVRSGGIRVIFEYANRLTERGHNVMLLTPIIPFNIYGRIWVPHFLKYRIKCVLKYLFKSSTLPLNIFERKFKIKYVIFINDYFVPEADLVIATAWQTAESVYRLKKSKGKKFYLIQDYEIWYGDPNRINESYQLPLNRITISDYLRELLQQKFNAESVKITIGRDYNKYSNDNKIYHNPRAILFMDHPLENRNIDGAINTIRKIKLRYPEVRIMCFGLSRFHKMPDFVEFYQNPSEDAIVNLYCSSDIFLFSSKYEGFGGPPAEAMACKCAVVGNAVGALPEYAINGRTAVLCDPNDPEELFDGVCRLLDNEDELKRISGAGFEQVRKTLNWDSVLDKFEELIKKTKLN